MKSFVKRLFRQLTDAARFAPLTESALAFAYGTAARFAQSPLARLDYLARMYARANSPRIYQPLAKKIHLLAQRHGLTSVKLHPRADQWLATSQMNRGIMLKAPRANGEKGVLFISREENLVRLLANNALPAILREFTIWTNANWSPADYRTLLSAVTAVPDVLYVSPGNLGEIKRLEAFHPKIKVIPTLASDWIHPELFSPKPRSSRQIDIIMVAGWGSYKRHWQLFAALRRMPRGLRVSLIGNAAGSATVRDIHRLARDYDVRQELEIHNSLPAKEVYSYLSNSRVSVIMSKREGACVAVTESLFANTPVGLLRGARVGASAHINPQTGVFLQERRLARELGEFLDCAEEFSPRRWAVEHVACDLSLGKANAILRADANRAGTPWTSDLVPFCWHPDLTYVSNDDRSRLLPVYADLQTRFPDLIDSSFASAALQPTAVCEGNWALADTLASQQGT